MDALIVSSPRWERRAFSLRLNLSKHEKLLYVETIAVPLKYQMVICLKQTVLTSTTTTSFPPPQIRGLSFPLPRAMTLPFGGRKSPRTFSSPSGVGETSERKIRLGQGLQTVVCLPARRRICLRSVCVSRVFFAISILVWQLSKHLISCSLLMCAFLSFLSKFLAISKGWRPICVSVCRTKVVRE